MGRKGVLSLFVYAQSSPQLVNTPLRAHLYSPLQHSLTRGFAVGVSGGGSGKGCLCVVAVPANDSFVHGNDVKLVSYTVSGMTINLLPSPDR